MKDEMTRAGGRVPASLHPSSFIVYNAGVIEASFTQSEVNIK
jgi:hypothetical protein